MRTNIPDDVPSIAVYLLVTDTPRGLELTVAECAIDDGREQVPGLQSVQLIRHRRPRLPHPGGYRLAHSLHTRRRGSSVRPENPSTPKVLPSSGRVARDQKPVLRQRQLQRRSSSDQRWYTLPP